MNDHCDRFSDLSDCVLIKILSLLNDTREVARTCILSKRWEKVWASVPCLNFNVAGFLSEEEEERTEEGLQRDIEHFKIFVSRFLDLRESNIDIREFKLTCDLTRCIELQIPTGILRSAGMWIHDALNYKPKNLHVMLGSSVENFHLPDCFFTCESLEEVYLDIDIVGYCEIQPDVVLLPNLRMLFLFSVIIERGCMEKILAGCPALESLSLHHSYLKETCSISFQTLKSLTIFNTRVDSDQISNWYISAPNLKYLNLDVHTPPKLKDMSKVTKAKISTGVMFVHYHHDLLSTLSGVEDLELHNYFLEKMLIGVLPNCPTFHNLKILTLGKCSVCCQFGLIPSFLECCPNLEHLILLHDSGLCQKIKTKRRMLKRRMTKRMIHLLSKLKVVNALSGRKIQLSGKVEKMNDHCDRLSDLPDCVLTKILSLLKAREVTQTCILSKRWEKLWASVPCLNFNFSEFRTIPENLQSDIEHFKNFVSQFLHLREDSMPIERFKLKCDVMDSETRIRILSSTRMWIRDALNHKPKNLHVIIRSSHENFHLPYCLVTCESLVEEYLDIQGTWYCDIQPDIVLLPKLRTLFFSCVTIKRDCMKKILAGCPALESLSLYHCDLNMRNITLWTLKSLTIINGDFGEESSRWYISAPNLEYLNIAEAVNFSSKLKDMSKVTKAKIFITDFNSHFDGYLLSTLSGVEDLELLNVDLKELLRGELPYCPTFHNLKNLTLGRCCVCCQFGPIPSFLIHCPNLEHLVLLHVSALCQICHDEEEEDLNVEEFERFEWKNLQLVEVEYEAPYHDLLPTWHHDVLLLERLLLHCTMNIEGVQITLTEEEELCFYPLILVA